MQRILARLAGSRREIRPPIDDFSVLAAEQFVLDYWHLYVNYVAVVQLTTASESNVLRRVRQCSRI